MRCHCANPLAMTMSHSEKNPGRLFFRCCRRLCPFFQWVDEDPRRKNRVWLEEDKFICLFDGRMVKRTLQDVLTETPLQKGVRKKTFPPSIWKRWVVPNTMYLELSFPVNPYYPVVGFTKTTNFITVPWPNVTLFGNGTKHCFNNLFLSFCIIIDFRQM